MRNTFLSRTGGLLILASVVLAGCHNGLTEKHYVSSADSHVLLKMKSTVTTKSRLISTFHGVRMGSFAIENDEGVLATGTFTEDENGIRFEAEDGSRLSVKVNSDGSFDYAKRTWHVKARLEEVRAAAASPEETSR